MVSFSCAFAVAAALVTAPVAAYQTVANCVPGDVVAGLSFTNGKIGAYAIALQAILPSTYGDLALLTESPIWSGQCMDAANAINSNKVIVEDVLDKYTDLKLVGVLGSMKNGTSHNNYLYVFKNKNFVDYELVSNCVPGGIVGANLLNKTGGKVGIYTVLLKAFMPMYGDLKFLSKGENGNCNAAMHIINGGNKTFFNALKSGEGDEGHMMKEVGVLESMKKAEEDSSYLFVYQNKNWNSTYGVMDGYEEDEGESQEDKGETEETDRRLSKTEWWKASNIFV